MPCADAVFAPVFGGAEDDVDVDTDVDEDEDEDVGKDFDVGVDGMPPQPAKMVVTRIMRQIFTRNSPALDWGASAVHMPGACGGAWTCFVNSSE